jgi:WD40 repeat protein
LDFALSPDNKWLAFATTNHVMQLSDATTGKMEGEIVSDVEKLAFSPDGKILAAGGSTGVVTLYEPRTFTEIAPLKPSKKVGKVYGLEFSPDGKWLAVVKWDELVVWNLDEQKEKHFLTQQGVKKIVFAPNSKTLVSTADFEIRLWDVLTGNQIHNRQGHDDWVSWLANSPDGKLLASISFRDSVVNVWEAVTGKPVCRIPTTGSVRRSMFSNDSKTLISAMSFNGAFYFSAAVTGKELRRFSIEDIDGNARRFMDVITFSLSPDGKRLTAISSNQDRYQMNILDGSTDKPLFQRHLSGDWFPSRFTPDGSAVSSKRRWGSELKT